MPFGDPQPLFHGGFARLWCRLASIRETHPARLYPVGARLTHCSGSTGALSTSAMARMETEMPWFRELSAEDRSWVGLIVQAGIRGFVDWYRRDGGRPDERSVRWPPRCSAPHREPWPA